LIDYENAGLYASYLLEIYTEYKSIWKELQVNCEDLQAGVPDMELAKVGINQPIQDRIKQAAEAADPANAANPANPTKVAVPASEVINEAGSKRSTFKPSIPKYVPYEATVLGLVDARRDCRLEMLKIVHEVSVLLSSLHSSNLHNIREPQVDLVRQSPEISLDPERKVPFVHPAVFRNLLPVRSRSLYKRCGR
jgi:hypothetical protein